jgi:hypothetical protein
LESTVEFGFDRHRGEDDTTYRHDCYWVFRERRAARMSHQTSESRLRALIAEMREVVRDAGGSISKLTVARYADRLEAALAEGVPPAERVASQIAQRVAELPDRTSPDDWPEAMLVTQDELNQIVVEVLASVPPEPSQEQQ